MRLHINPAWASAAVAEDENWFSHALEAKNPPHAVRPMLEDGYPDAVSVTEVEAAEVIAWAATLPGWDHVAGQHPLIVLPDDALPPGGDFDP